MIKKFYLHILLFICLFQYNDIYSQAYIVSGDFDYPPFSYIDKTGKAVGLDIEILNAISDDAGIKFKYQLTEWGKALNNIKTGKTDIIIGIIFSKKREKFLDFSNPIHTGYYSIFIRKDLPLNALSDLYKYKLMVLNKDISIDKFLVPMGLYHNYDVAKSLPAAIAAIEWGRADFVIAPHSLGMNEIVKNNYENVQVKGPPIIPSIYCIAVKKGNTKLLGILNKGISDLREKKQLSKIKAKWKIYERNDFKYKRIVKNIWIGLIIAISVLLVVFLWVWSLRREIRKKTKKINSKNRELYKINAKKDKFLSIISHDLRSPFSSLLGLSEILSENVREYEIDEIEKLALNIHKSAQNSFNLLDDLLSWARTEQGDISFDPENLNLLELYNDVLINIKEIGDAKNIVINRNFNDKLSLFADRNMLRTILRNLMSNAIKFSNNDRVVEVAAKESDNHITVIVSDVGVGISSDNLLKLFDISEKISTIGTSGETGTGLGLILCKEFVEKHGGKIWAESELEKGSVFYFTIPK